jgi:hypothetical protein
LVGQYREVTQRFPFHANTQTEILRIKNIDNKLFRCLSGKNSYTDKCTKIFPVTDVLFRTEEEQHASMAFIKAPDGDLYLQTGSGNYKKIGVKNGTVIPHQTQIKE